MFRIKICGITNVDDAISAANAGADAIGLNFFPGSSRCIAPETAVEIRAAVGEAVECVGVFVNASADEIERTCDTVGICVAQLHGEESPELLKLIDRRLSIVRARRLGDGGLQSIRDDLIACKAAADAPPLAILVDAAVPGQFGGTGRTVDWNDVASFPLWLDGVPLVLAGGLSERNVAEAIRTVQPHAVDVASGVESAPGRKDSQKVRRFVAAAREAFDKLAAQT